METPYRIHQMSGSYNEAFGLDERIFCMLFEPQKLNAGPHLMDRLLAFEREMRKMFRMVLKKGFEGHENEGRACLVIYHPDLKDAIIVTLREIYRYTAESVLDLINDEDFDTTKLFKLSFNIICACNE